MLIEELGLVSSSSSRALTLSRSGLSVLLSSLNLL